MILTGGLLVAFSMGRWLAPLAAWIGPVLIIRYARDHKVWRGYAVIFAVYIVAIFIAFFSIWWGGLPRVMAPFLVVGIALLWSLPYLADRLISPRIGGFWGTFVFPLAATTLELVNARFNPLGAWGATGFGQYGNLPLMQLASVTGMIGITFLMGWFAGVANWLWENRHRGPETIRGLAVFGLVFAATFLYGYLRLNLAPTLGGGETVRVAGIIAQSLNDMSAGTNELTSADEIQQVIDAHWELYVEETVREAQAGARVIVWPEGAGAALDDPGPWVTRAQELAREQGIYLYLPVFTQPSDKNQPYENKLLVIDPAGTIVMEHFKYGGALTEGNRVSGDGKLLTVDTPLGMLSGIICYDLDYPAVVQQAGRNGTGLMVVPSKDWLSIDPVHSHMAVFRAIENGMSVVRHTDAGLSIAVDPYGRILAQTDFFGATDRTLVAQVPVQDVQTAYALFGRWFEWLCLAGFVLVVVVALIRTRATT